MINAHHPGLRALLEFEAARLQVPIEYMELPDAPTAPVTFVPRIEIRAYNGSEIADLSIPGVDSQIAYSGPYNAPGDPSETDVRLGGDDDAAGLLVARVVSHRVFVFMSLETLFGQADSPQSDNIGPTVNPAHQVFDAIMSQALPLAAQNILYRARLFGHKVVVTRPPESAMPGGPVWG
jgi:hypothetical protein